MAVKVHQSQSEDENDWMKRNKASDMVFFIDVYPAEILADSQVIALWAWSMAATRSQQHFTSVWHHIGFWTLQLYGLPLGR